MKINEITQSHDEHNPDLDETYGTCPTCEGVFKERELQAPTGECTACVDKQYKQFPNEGY